MNHVGSYQNEGEADLRRVSSARRRKFRLLSAGWLVLGLGITIAPLLHAFSRPSIPDILKLALVILIYLFVVQTLRKMRHLPRASLPGIFTLLITVLYGSVSCVFWKITGEAPLLLAVSGALSFLTIAVWIWAARHYVYLNLAVLPGMLAEDLLQADPIGIRFTRLSRVKNAGDIRHSYDGVVFDSKERISSEWYHFLLQLRFAGVQLFEASKIYEMVTGRVSLVHLSRGYAGELLSERRMYTNLKRVLDILAVVIALPLLLLIIAATWILIRLESPGKAFFVQQRVGKNNREFRLYKFRSMYQDSEKHGPRFARHNDSRITRVGAVIRKFRIDELPQVLNILRGDMSWLGPRPEQPRFVQQFEQEIPYYSSRHLIRPGITGWAQVTQGYAADTEEASVKLSYDLYYLKNFGFWLELLIIFKTIKAILTGFGAR